MMEITDLIIDSYRARISATAYRSTLDGGNKSIVVISTGLGGRKEWFEKKAMDICGGGNHVLLFDYRGHGKSEGTADRYTIMDLHAAIGSAERIFGPERLPVFLGGLCMGGIFSLQAASRYNRVIGVIGMSIAPGGLMPPDMWRMITDTMRSEKNGHYVRLDPSYIEEYKRYDIRNFLKWLKNKSLFIIHYEEDEITPVDDVFRTYIWSDCEKDFLILNGGRHIEPYHNNDMNDYIVNWINKKKQTWYGRYSGQ